ncbi:MAG: ABC transporter permease [Mycoplasma sp.]|nr:ABC transporter permease [Mycoplasma sp.]
MFVYFRYLAKVIFSKIPLWLITIVGYVFALTFLIIVPALTKTSPILMWNFDVINIQTMFITVEAIKSALLIGYAFKSDVEDGSELIIYSKPLKRIKILLPKLLWIILANLLFDIGYVLIGLSTMAFGKYNAISNPSGMQYDKVLSLVGSLIIGPFIVGLIFSSLSMFIGNFGNKLKILISVSIVAIVLSIYDVIGSVVMSSKSKTITSKHDGTINSFTIRTNDLKSNNFSYYNTQPAVDLYDIDKANLDKGNYIYQILNINYQLSNFYRLFNLDDVKTTLEVSTYGEYPKFKSFIRSKEDNLLKYLENVYNTSNQNSYPFIMPISTDIYYEKKTNDKYNSLGFLFLGLNSSIASWLRYLGAGPHDIWLSNITKLFDLMPSTYISDINLLSIKGNIVEFDTNVYNNITQKVLTDEKFTEIFNVNDQINQTYSQNAQKEFDLLCYQFIVDNKDKYGFILGNLININLSIAKIQYSMLKQFCMIYWTQIIQQLISDSELNINKYLTNEDNKFQNSFKEEVDIWNPYIDSEKNKIQISVDKFTRCFLAYSGIGQIDSSWKGWVERRFACSCYGIDESGNPLFENDSENKKNYFFMFPCQYVTVYNQQGYDISKVYWYQTSEFYTHTSTSIFWCIASFIFFVGSMITYLRNDIS